MGKTVSLAQTIHKIWFSKELEQCLKVKSLYKSWQWLKFMTKVRSKDNLKELNSNKKMTDVAKLVQVRQKVKETEVKLALTTACNMPIHAIDHLSEVLVDTGGVLSDLRLHRTKCTALSTRYYSLNTIIAFYSVIEWSNFAVSVWSMACQATTLLHVT